MKTRTTLFTAPKKLEIQEYELPAPGPRQVLVKVRACALCTWEQRFYKGSSPQDYPFRGGHEVSGDVVALGKDANCDAKVGDPVSVAIMTRCGACESCRRGMDNFCENDDGGNLPGLPWGPGGLSDYILLEDYQVYRAEKGRDYAELALAEPVACVVRSVNRPELQPGDAVLVQGSGIMGLIHVALLQRRELRVMVSEPDAGRRAKSMRAGAHLALDPFNSDFEEACKSFTNGKGFNSVFFTAGGGPAIEQAMKLLGKRGWLCLYGSVHPKGPVQVDPNLVHYSELVVTGTYSHTKQSFRQAVAMLSQGMIDVAPFISERLPFPEVEAAFERAISPDTYRVVVTFNG